MDTFFIISKRSWKQLSFLHVYHHFTIFLFYWLNLRTNYDGDVYLTIVLNGFIHSIMCVPRRPATNHAHKAQRTSAEGGGVAAPKGGLILGSGASPVPRPP